MHYCKNFEVRKDLTTGQKRYFCIPLPLSIFNLSFLVNIVYMKDLVYAFCVQGSNLLHKEFKKRYETKSCYISIWMSYFYLGEWFSISWFRKKQLQSSSKVHPKEEMVEGPQDDLIEISSLLVGEDISLFEFSLTFLFRCEIVYILELPSVFKSYDPFCV
jgi:hypothetical protein